MKSPAPPMLVRLTDPRLKAVQDGHQVFTSLEGENPGGSIKDHMVAGELKELLAKGTLKPGDAISEISAGSTALSLAFYARELGLACSLFVPKHLPEGALARLRSLGASLHPVEIAGGHEAYDRFSHETGIRRFDQFGDARLSRHYHSLGRALGHQKKLELVIGAVGTGHSLTGIADGLDPRVAIASAEPETPAAVPGIRNLRIESLGAKDPCDPFRFRRIELGEYDHFPDNMIESDEGTIAITPSFQVVLGALSKALIADRSKLVFAVGAANKRVE